MSHSKEPGGWSRALFFYNICLDLISASVFAIVITWSFSFSICSACNTHCGSCDSQASCTSCRDPSKVLLFGECQYESCAPQYYLDVSTKTCKGKALPELYSSSFTQWCPFAIDVQSIDVPTLGIYCHHAFILSLMIARSHYACMYSFVHLFVKQIFLSIYYVPDIVQEGIGN